MKIRKSLESGSGSHRRSIRQRSAVANLRLLQHVWKPSLFMSTPVMVFFAVTVRKLTTEVPASLTRHIWAMISPLPCATPISATGNGTEEPRQEHEGVLKQGLPWEPGCRSDLDSPHGQSGAVRGKPVAHPAQTPERGEPTMRKGSYSEELDKIDLHVENLSLPPRSPKEQ